MELSDQLRDFWREHLDAICVAGVSLRVIWHYWKRNRYLGELCRRQQQSAIARGSEFVSKQNAMWQELLKIFTDAPPPTLTSLADDTETPFTLKP